MSTFKVMQDNVIAKLSESATPQYWGLTEIKLNINHGAREFMRRTKFKKTTAVLTASGSGWALPATMLVPIAVYSAGVKLDQTSPDFLDGVNPAWQGATAAAPTNWLFNEGIVYLYPIPTVAPIVKMRFVASPTALSADADVPSEIPLEYHLALEFWALFECFAREGDGQDLTKAGQWKALFDSMVAEFAETQNQWNLISGGETGFTFQSMIHQVMTKLGENPLPRKYTIDEIKQGINRGMREFARATGFKQTTATLVLGSGTYALPAGMLFPKAVYVGGTKIDPTTPDYLDALNPAWRSVTGATPTNWIMDANKIRLYPQQSGTPTVELRYVDSPTALSAATDVPELPPGYQDAPINWCLSEIYGREGHAAATLFGSLFKKLADEYLASINQWNLQSIPDTGYTFQNLLSIAISKLNEAPTPRKYSTEEIKNAINRGVYEFAKRSEWKVITSTLVASGNYFTPPTGLLAAKALYYGGSKLDFITPELLDGISAAWRSETGTPKKWMFDNAQVRLYPLPTSALTVELRHVPKPAALSASTDVPDIKTEFFDAIWQWAIYELLERDHEPGNIERAKTYLQMFSTQVDECRIASDLSMYASVGENDTSFGSMIYRVAETLKPFGGLKRWSLAEVKSAINKGYQEFVRKTECKTTRATLAQNFDGTFVMPADVLIPKDVYFGGRRLDFIQEQYLDDLIGGTGLKQGTIGEAGVTGTDWRNTTSAGDPELFMISDGNVRLYPAPTIASVFTPKSTQSGTIAAGKRHITLATALSTSVKSKILVTINGFAQQTTAYTIVTPKSIVLDAVVPIVTPWTVEEIEDSEDGTITAGTTSITLTGTIMDVNVMKLFLGTIEQTNETDWMLNSGKSIEIIGTIGGTTPYKIVWYSGTGVTMIYVPNPAQLEEATDLPDLIQEGYRQAIERFAAFNLLSSEPKAKGKAAEEITAFNSLVSDYGSFFTPAVIKLPEVPFRI